MYNADTTPTADVASISQASGSAIGYTGVRRALAYLIMSSSVVYKAERRG